MADFLILSTCYYKYIVAQIFPEKIKNYLRSIFFNFARFTNWKRLHDPKNLLFLGSAWLSLEMWNKENRSFPESPGV